ncbi:hypothetical protein [Shouchella hunanensis]|uniref:Uncharacterized protein n=1 Tax=Shouchella hunanensis TaxID=766894 RepID=A0ABY7W3A2_9BACI|nr:hypothetical protein [Shouchella hunanensis]WDF02919.1 hypothetical protein PQ477_15640 [Shouchella hunanensis]
MEINRRRKRAIEKERVTMERYEDWKEWVLMTGGTLYKGKDGRIHGVHYGN